MEDKTLYAGTWRAICYEFCHFLDEISHALRLDRFEFGFRFCQWAHRLDYKEKENERE